MREDRWRSHSWSNQPGSGGKSSAVSDRSFLHHYRSNGLATAVIDLDKDRPARYVRNFKPHTPGGYLPEYQPTHIPEERNDLKETILRQRRPDLYLTLAPQTPTPP